MKKLFLIFSVLLGFTTTAHSMESISKLAIRLHLKKNPPKALCYEAGYGEFENADGSKFTVNLIGPTNARVGRVKEYQGSNHCYDFYLIDPAQRSKADKEERKNLIQVRVFNNAIKCNPLSGKSIAGADGELLEPPIRSGSAARIDIDGNLEREHSSSYFAYRIPSVDGPSRDRVFEFNEAFIPTSKFAGSYANDHKNRNLGQIQFTCGRYAAINNVLYKIERLKSLRTKPGRG